MWVENPNSKGYSQHEPCRLKPLIKPLPVDQIQLSEKFRSCIVSALTESLASWSPIEVLFMETLMACCGKQAATLPGQFVWQRFKGSDNC